MLPLSRNTTYTPGDPIKSDDLDTIEDCIVAGAHGAVVDNYHLGAGTMTNAGVSGDGEVTTTGAGSLFFYGIKARVGDVLTGAKLLTSGNGTVDILHARVLRNQADGTTDDLGDTPISNVGSTWTLRDLAFTAPVEVAAGDSFYFEVTYNAGGLLMTTLGISLYHDLP